MLNALELTSGKLVEDGELSAAAAILGAEIQQFRNALPASAWRNHVDAVVMARRDAYSATAPGVVIQRADALRDAAQAALNFLANPGETLSEADRILLEGLANESKVQADLLRASAHEMSKTFALGLVDEFADLAWRMLRWEYELPGDRLDPDYMVWIGRARLVETGLKAFIRDMEPHTFFGAREGLSLTNNPVGESTTTGRQLMEAIQGKESLRNLLDALAQLSRGFYMGNIDFERGKARIPEVLRAAGLNQLADRYVQEFIQSARTRDALNLAFELQQRQDAQRWREQTLQQLTQEARDFVTRDIPIMLVSAAFSYGTLAAAHGAWRVMTGIRLSARLLWAADFAISIPINQAVERALGRQVDDSFMGTMRTAGMMLGTQVGFRVFGHVASRTFSALRSRLPNVISTPLALDRRGTMPVINASRGRYDFRQPGVRVRRRADAIVQELNRRGEVLDATGDVVGLRDVTRLRLTADELMALSERYNREYALITFRDGTQWLYAGRIGAGEVRSLAGRDIVRHVHTEPMLRRSGDRVSIPPSIEDINSYLAHRSAGGGGNLEIIVRELETGRVVTHSYTLEEVRAWAILHGLNLAQ